MPNEIKNMRQAADMYQNQFGQQLSAEKLVKTNFFPYDLEHKKENDNDGNIQNRFRINDKCVHNANIFEKTNHSPNLVRPNSLDFVLSNLAAIAGAYQNSFSSSKPNLPFLLNEKNPKNN